MAVVLKEQELFDSATCGVNLDPENHVSIQCLFQLRFATRPGGSYTLVPIIHPRNGL